MQGTIKQIDLKHYIGMPVIKVMISEYGVSLFFKQNRQLDITTHWEFFDTKTNTCIDRGLSLKLRENFFLYKLIGKKLLSCEKILHLRELVFDNDYKVSVHIGKTIL
jgi:hypothetical protein